MLADIGIKGIINILPKEIEYNDQIHWINDHLKQRLIDVIGINKRHIAPNHQSLVHYAQTACNEIITKSKIEVSEIGFLLLITQTPDHKIPNTASILASNIGLNSSTIIIEINAGCSGYVQGLYLARQLFSGAVFSYGLLVCGDLSSHILQPEDSGTIPLFSDALSATLLYKAHSEISQFEFGNLDNNHDAISLQRINNTEEYLKLDGHKILSFGLQNVVPGVGAFLKKVSLKNEIDYYFFHQASKIINQSIQKKLNIPPEKCPESLSSFGNTSSATIPVTMSLISNLTTKSNNVLICGFGTGLSWSVAAIDLPPIEFMGFSFI